MALFMPPFSPSLTVVRDRPPSGDLATLCRGPFNLTPLSPLLRDRGSRVTLFSNYSLFFISFPRQKRATLREPELKSTLFF